MPGEGLLGTSGVESGRAAPLVGGPPGVELHTAVDALPSADTGDIVPIVRPPIGVAMVPSAVAGIIAMDDIVVVDGDIVDVLPAMDVATVLGTVDGADMGDAVMAGGGGAAIVGVGDTGTVEPGSVDMKDVAGCADSKSGALVPLVVDVKEVAGTADVVSAADIDGVVPPPNADMEITDTAGVPSAICPVGVEQVTTVPGVVGSEASGTGASVVSGVPG